MNSGYAIRFSWSPKPDEVFLTSLPESKIKIQLDNSEVEPTVEFIFNDFWLNNNFDVMFTEHFSRERLANLNSFIEGEDFQVAVIRISQETLNRESCLPH